MKAVVVALALALASSAAADDVTGVVFVAVRGVRP